MHLYRRIDLYSIGNVPLFKETRKDSSTKMHCLKKPFQEITSETLQSVRLRDMYILMYDNINVLTKFTYHAVEYSQTCDASDKRGRYSAMHCVSRN